MFYQHKRVFSLDWVNSNLSYTYLTVFFSMKYLPLLSEADNDNEFALSAHSAIDDDGDGAVDFDADVENPFSMNSYAMNAMTTQSTTSIVDSKTYQVESSSKFGQFCRECCGINLQSDNARVRRRKYCLTTVEVAAAITCCYWFEKIIHNKFCNFLFKCNCTWTWAGGWDNCNVWNTNGGPKCPWCTARITVSWTTDYLLFAIMLLTYFVALYNRRKIDLTLRWCLPVLMYFLVGTLVGYLFKVTGSYPYFIW